MKAALNVKVFPSKRSSTGGRSTPSHLGELFLNVSVKYCAVVKIGFLFLFECLANMLIACQLAASGAESPPAEQNRRQRGFKCVCERGGSRFYSGSRLKCKFYRNDGFCRELP